MSMPTCSHATQHSRHACSFVTLAPFLMYQLKWRAQQGGCKGLAALGFNAAFNACLLALFLQFYHASYQRSKHRAKSA
jgi:hypothetical protein